MGLRFANTLLLIIVGIAGMEIAILAQAAGAKRPSFEVASIKPNHAGPGFGGLGTRPGGFFSATNVTALLLIRGAYRVQDFQIIGGPSWINTDRFDIEARAEAGEPPSPTAVRDRTKPDTTALMIQALLEDRFQLKVHHETRDLPEFAVTIGKNGPKLKTVDPPAVPGQRSNAGRDTPAPQNGVPLPGSIGIGGGRIRARAIQLQQFLSVLSQQLRRPVIDNTNLNGYYDIELVFNEPTVGPDGREDGPLPANDPATPSLFTAIQEQLGLKLEPTKGPVDVLVIDSIQKPSEN